MRTLFLDLFILLCSLLPQVYSQIYNFNSPLTIEKSLVFPGNYAIIVALPSEILYTTIAFDQSAPTTYNSRILYAKQFTQLTLGSGTVTIPPLFLVNHTNISLHYVHLNLGSSSTFAILCSKTRKYFDFPSTTDSFDYRDDSFASLPDGYDYLTHVYSQYLEHDFPMDVYCNLTLTGVGIVRRLYINDDMVGEFKFPTEYPIGTTTDETATIYNVRFRAGQLNLVTAIGYRLKLTDISIDQCFNSANYATITLPTFTYYYTSTENSSTIFPSETLQTNTSLSLGNCPAKAIKCLSSTVALRCQNEYYLWLHKCSQTTPVESIYYMATSQSILMRNFNSYTAYINFTGATGDNRLDLSIYVDTPRRTRNLCLFQYFSSHLISFTGHPWYESSPNYLPEAVPVIFYLDNNGFSTFYNEFLPFGTAPSLLTYCYEVDESVAMMLEVYTAPQISTNADKMKYNSYSLIPAGNTATWPSANFARVITYLECNTTCQVSFYGNGTIEIYKNGNTFVGLFNMGITPANITLSRIFSGVTQLEFLITGGGILGVYVSGTGFKQYGHSKLNNIESSASITGPNTNPAGTSCYNGYNSVCFSCMSGKVLDGTTCVTTCSTGKINGPERLCVPTCDDNLVEVNSTHCLPRCSPGKFYIESSGCSGNCMPGCILCAEAAQCLECHPETTMDGSQKCVSNSYINVHGSPSISSCSDLFLSAEIDPVEEQQAPSPFTYIWSVASDSGVDPAEATLNNYLATQRGKDIKIPAVYLKPNIEYTFTCSYLNKFGMNISTTFTTSTDSDLIPSVVSSGGPVQQIKRFKENLIKLSALYSSCLLSNNTLDVTWDLVGGDALANLPNYIHPETPLWLQFPSCSLPYDTNYNLQAKVYKTGYSTDFATVNSTMIVKLICTNPSSSSCVKIGPNTEYLFEAEIEDSEFQTTYTYTWSTTPSLQVATYKNLMKVAPDLDILQDSIRININLVNITYSGSAFIDVPVNHKPSNGSLSVTPPSGRSLSTYFYIRASDWLDDGDYPLSYQLYFTVNPEDRGTWKPLTDIQRISFTNTYLSAKTPSQMIYVGVRVIDSLDLSAYSYTDVEVGVNEATVAEAVTKMEGLVNVISGSSNPYENARMSLLISTEIVNWEAASTENLNGCPYCSNHGTCDAELNQCRCNSGWGLPDCSLKQETFGKIVKLKENSLDIAYESYQKIQTEEMKNMLLQTLETLSSSPFFNSNETIAEMQRILDEVLADTLLTLEQSQIVLNILKNMIKFVGSEDCNCQTEFCANLQEKAQEYLDQVSNDTLNSKIPNEKPVILETDLFDVLTAKTTPCNIANLNLSLGSDAPKIIIEPETYRNLDCTQEISVKLYAFKDRRQIFSCTGVPIINDYKNVIMTSLSDSLGNPILSGFSTKIVLPSTVPCFRECKPIDSICFCPFLDAKLQFTKIFKDQISVLENLAALRDWEFQKSSMFWTNVGLFIGFLFVSYLVARPFRSSCIYTSYIKSKEKDNCSKFCTALMISNPLMKSLFVLDFGITKNTKVLLYYLRLVLYATLSAICARSGSIKGLGNLINNMQFYVILLPYITILPINSFMHNIMIESTPRKRRGEVTKRDWKNILIHVLTFILVIICIIAMFLIAAQKTVTQRRAWSGYFLVFILQDLLIVPLVYMGFHYILFKLVRRTDIRMIPPLHYRIYTILNRDLEEIYEGKGTNKAKITPSIFELKQPSDKHSNRSLLGHENDPSLLDKPSSIRELKNDGQPKLDIIKVNSKEFHIRPLTPQDEFIVSLTNVLNEESAPLTKSRPILSSIHKSHLAEQVFSFDENTEVSRSKIGSKNVSQLKVDDPITEKDKSTSVLPKKIEEVDDKEEEELLKLEPSNDANLSNDENDKEEEKDMYEESQGQGLENSRGPQHDRNKFKSRLTTIKIQDALVDSLFDKDNEK